MNAEILAVGTELLLGETIDTNSAEISLEMAALGVNVYYKSTIGDNAVRMAAVLSQAMTRSEIVIVTGGLGPTNDDITREVLAGVTGRELVTDEEALAHIKQFFQSTGREMTANNARQALIPEGARILPNPRGTAPGIYLKAGRTHVFCIPGVPTEMRTMLKESVVPEVASLMENHFVIRSRTMKFYGIGESALAAEVEDLLDGSNPTVAPYAGLGDVRLRITARSLSEREAWDLIEPVEEEIRKRVGAYLYGYNEETLESVVGKLLLRNDAVVTVAESCTGGLVGHRLTNLPGASRYFGQGWVTYSNEAKEKELGVPKDMLAKYGAVSAEVAGAMAKGALEKSGADIAVAITGIAGPDGGTPSKPVGLVFFGCALRGSGVRTHSRQFRGPREDIKWRAANEALNTLRLTLLEPYVL